MPLHPIQPLVIDSHGTLRFQENGIIRKLIDSGVIKLNDVAMLDGITQDDRNQFAQLIGYSLDGYGSLSYADDLTYTTAYHMHHSKKSEVEAKLEYLEGLVSNLRLALRAPIAELFGMHESDIPV
jgi:hypothetical protein